MTQYTEAPTPGDLFPLLKDVPNQRRKEAESDPDKDDVIFHMITSSLTVPPPK